MQLLTDYTFYNHWANTRIVHWLQGMPGELLYQETPSSFPTLLGTLLHIWGAEDIWLRRLKGESPVHFLGNTFEGAPQDLFAGLIANSLDFAEFLAAQPPGFFAETCRYHTTNGKEHTQPNAGIILHCIQHSTFHRGQIITMARSLGRIDPPVTDYIAYLRENQGV